MDSGEDSEGRGEGEEEQREEGGYKKSPPIGLSPAPDLDKVGLGTKHNENTGVRIIGPVGVGKVQMTTFFTEQNLCF